MPKNLEKLKYEVEDFFVRFSQSPFGHIRSAFEQAEWRIELPKGEADKLEQDTKVLKASKGAYLLYRKIAEKDESITLQFNRRPLGKELDLLTEKQQPESMFYKRYAFKPVFGAKKVFKKEPS